MPRILFLNDYPMGKALRLCEAGEYPSQHLWGMREIGQHGFKVDYFPDRTWLGPPQLARFAVQQVQAALRASRADLIYSASQHNVWLLARMRRLGLLRKPLVSIVHHPLRGMLQNGAFVRGHDRLLFLSRLVEGDVKRRFRCKPDATATLGWGPDLSFAENSEADGAPVDVLAAGKTNRDFATFVEALRDTPWSAAIYCARGNLAKVGELPANVVVHTDETGHVLGYRELYGRSRRARVLAVPLAAVNALAGLTSVVDALALGKPLIMTRNRWLDFDPQAEGMGYSIDVGDVAGWRQALRRILSDPDLERRMGQRARAIGEQMNTQTFATELACHFENVLQVAPTTDNKLRERRRS
jgi:glycosyltransferase involved in cell wall biosynthesis